MGHDTRAEALPVSYRLWGPRHFGHGRQSWHRQVFHSRDVANSLAPDRRLDAEDVPLGHSLHVRRRIPVVGVSYFDVRCPVLPKLGRRCVLHVEIHLWCGREYQLGAVGHRRRGRIALPLMCDRGRVEMRLSDFFPADHLLPVFVDDRLNALDELYVLLGRKRLHLVATDVKVGARSHCTELADHVINESVRLLFVHAERTPADVGSRIESRGPRAARQLRIADEGGVDVARHVDLRHDQDVACLCVAQYVLVILLGIEAPRSASDLRERPHRGQLRARIDLYSPSLIVGQVQVQHVQLVQREDVEVLLHFPHREEVTADVEHGAAVGEARLICNAERGNAPVVTLLPHLRFNVGGQ